MPNLTIKEKVDVLESEMLKMPQQECPVVHRFGPNIYIREVTIPADTFSIGHYQKTEHLNIMLTGRVTMVNMDGSKTELVAPQTFVCGAGRKIGYIHETMIWQNVYSTSETDIEKLEEMFLDKSPNWIGHQKAEALLIGFDHSEDVADYYKAIDEFGFKHDEVRMQTENTEDQIPLPYGNYKMMVSPSKIDGRGVFATGWIRSGEVIAPARIDGKRTPAGRYTNHSKTPNAMMYLLPNGNINLVATRDISGCHGGNVGEEITIDYRQALSLSIRSN